MKYADMTPEQKARRLATKRAYRKANPDKCRAEAKRQRDKNPAAAREKRRRNRLAHPEKTRAKKRRYVETHPEQVKAGRLRPLGFTLESYNAALLAQGNRCAICTTAFSALPSAQVHADHDHATGVPRGVLCHQCNTGLGMFKDSAERLFAAIRYLEQPTLAHETRSPN